MKGFDRKHFNRVKIDCKQCHNCKTSHCGNCENFIQYSNSGGRPNLANPGVLDPVLFTVDKKPIHARFFGQSSFAKHSICHSSSVIPIPSWLKDYDSEVVGAFGCGWLTGCGTTLNVICQKPTESLAVLGTGSVGISALLAGKAAGIATLIAVDIDDSRLAFCKSLGIQSTINSRGMPAAKLVEAIKGFTPRSQGVDGLIDTTGIPAVIRSGIDALANQGRAVSIASSGQTEISLNVQDMMRKAITYSGMLEGQSDPPVTIPILLKLWSDGKLPLDKMAVKYPAREINTAIKEMESGKTIKGVLIWKDV